MYMYMVKERVFTVCAAVVAGRCNNSRLRISRYAVASAVEHVHGCLSSLSCSVTGAAEPEVDCESMDGCEKCEV